MNNNDESYTSRPKPDYINRPQLRLDSPQLTINKVNYECYFGSSTLHHQKRFENPYEKYVKKKESVDAKYRPSSKSKHSVIIANSEYDREKVEKLKKSEYICVFNKLSNKYNSQKNESYESYSKGMMIKTKYRF